jgi:hypothetical protein
MQAGQLASYRRAVRQRLDERASSLAPMTTDALVGIAEHFEVEGGNCGGSAEGRRAVPRRATSSRLAQDVGAVASKEPQAHGCGSRCCNRA